MNLKITRGCPERRTSEARNAAHGAARRHDEPNVAGALHIFRCTLTSAFPIVLTVAGIVGSLSSLGVSKSVLSFTMKSPALEHSACLNADAALRLCCIFVHNHTIEAT